MIKTILFDLDDTLLGNSMDTFLPQYFALLQDYATRVLKVENFVPSVLQATKVMAQDTDPAATNYEIFWRAINQLLDLDFSMSEGLFDDFYLGDFNQLQGITQTFPAAAELIRACFRQGYQIVIATNPMFPRLAVEARLTWAGVPTAEFSYKLVTTIENMHATKPHQAYYREILAKINCAPEDALMVGDDWQRDIEPAAGLGLFTYWIQLPETTLPDATLPSAHGTLEELLARIESGWLQQLTVAT